MPCANGRSLTFCLHLHTQKHQKWFSLLAASLRSCFLHECNSERETSSSSSVVLSHVASITLVSSRFHSSWCFCCSCCVVDDFPQYNTQGATVDDYLFLNPFPKGSMCHPNPTV